MAIEISPTYLASLRFPRFAHLYAFVVFRPLVFRLRRLQRIFIPAPKQSAVLVPCRITTNLEDQSECYQKNSWAFAKDFFDNSFYQQLVTHYPKRRYLDPPSSITKAYDTGFKWTRGSGEPPYLDVYPVIKRLLDHLRSREFCDRITKFSGSNEPLSAYSFLVTSTYPGSLVAPHRDSFVLEEAGHSLNLVFFIDATGGKNSGALTLSKDNEYKNVIFEPPLLRNTCLIYNVRSPFFHGFKPVAFGKFRWAITCAFATPQFKGI
jgi:hypothetical protein